MIFRKKRKYEIARVEVTLRRADEAVAQGKAQGQGVEFLVNTIKDRREQNGFGADFTIALTPRKAR